MSKKPTICTELPPLEIWADGIADFVKWEDGEYQLIPDAPEWAKKKLDEYNAMLQPMADENGIVTQY